MGRPTLESPQLRNYLSTTAGLASLGKKQRRAGTGRGMGCWRVVDEWVGLGSCGVCEGREGGKGGGVFDLD